MLDNGMERVLVFTKEEWEEAVPAVVAGILVHA
jgi:hypothetical protein